jgi:copper(I)-binding protein
MQAMGVLGTGMGARAVRGLAVGALMLAVGLTGAAAIAQAQDYDQGTLTISNAWARPSAVKTGAVYFTLTNHGTADDALIRVEGDVAEKVQIHEMKMDGMVMRMRKLDRLPVPAGKVVEVAPGGTHIMLIGLAAPLVEGHSFPLTLVFDKAGSVEITVPVRSAADAASGAKPMSGMVPKP